MSTSSSPRSTSPPPAALAAIGYEPLGDLGVPQRWAFSRRTVRSGRTRTSPSTAASRSATIWVSVTSCAPTNACVTSTARKLELGAALDDIDDYVAGKSAILQRILERGISAAERRAIERINRS